MNIESYGKETFLSKSIANSLLQEFSYALERSLMVLILLVFSLS